MLKSKRYFLISGLILLAVIGALAAYLKIIYPTTSPLTTITFIASSVDRPHAIMDKQTIGFLPYWRLDDSKYLRLDLMSEVIYFSLSADENGEIVKVVDGETDPGWRWWKGKTIRDLIAKTQVAGSKFSLAVTMQKNKTLEAFLDNPAAQQNLINNLLEVVKTERLNGLNVDFEYAGEPESGYQGKFTQFATKLSAAFREQSPQTELSIDFFPLSVQKPRLFDIAKLAPLFDRIIVMSYDYYSGSSDLAGPVAPMTGYIATPSATQKGYFFDVTTTYDDYLKVVPAEKLVMGVPYYGWDYPVENNTQILSPVLEQNDDNGYAEVISYGRARTNPGFKTEDCQWDEKAQSTWCAYTNESEIQREVWLEDNRSIEVKFDFAKQQGLGGIAIWTLGYDKDYPDLWQMMTTKFTTPK